MNSPKKPSPFTAIATFAKQVAAGATYTLNLSRFVNKSKKNKEVQAMMNAKIYHSLWTDFQRLQQLFEQQKEEVAQLRQLIQDVLDIAEVSIENKNKLIEQYEKSQSWQVVNSEAVDYGQALGEYSAYDRIYTFVKYDYSKIKKPKLKNYIDLNNTGE